MKKTTRIFSFVLSLLMVLTLVPAMFVSATGTASTAASTWDGKVPGTNKTLVEVCAGETITLTLADYANDLDLSDGATIKTAAGLALFGAYSKGKVAFSDHTDTCAATVTGKTVRLAADIYLNAAGTVLGEGANEWVPMFNADTEVNLTFDGQGHFIYGMYIKDVTEVSNYVGFIGAFKGTGVSTIKNLAIVGGLIDHENRSTKDGAANAKGETSYVGGILGKMFPADGASLTVENCIAALDINATLSGTGNAADGFAGQDWQVYAALGIGYIVNIDVVINNVLTVGKLTAIQDRAELAGGAANEAQNALGAGVVSGGWSKSMTMNNVVSENIRSGWNNGGTLMQGHQFSKVTTNYKLYSFDNPHQPWGWNKPYNTTIDTAALFGAEMDLGDGWTQEAGRYPVPSAFADNHATIDSLIAPVKDETKEFKKDAELNMALASKNLLTITGCAVRLSDPNGLRFITKVNLAEDLADQLAHVETGTLIIPRKLIEIEGIEAVTVETAAALKIPTGVRVNPTESGFEYKAAIVNIPEKLMDDEGNTLIGLELDFVAVSYLGYKKSAEDEITYVYSAEAERSPVEIANIVYDDVNTPADTKAALREMFGDIEQFHGNPQLPKIEYLRWNGLVAGTTKTLREVMDGADVIEIDPAAVADHFDFTNKVIKTPQGLALFSAYVNGKVTLTGLNANAYSTWWNATIKLGANMDLSGHDWVPIGKNTASNTWMGTFDGQGYVISGMTIDVESQAAQLEKTAGAIYYGLFGRLRLGGAYTIQNLALMNSTIKVNNDKDGSALYVGGLVAYAEGGTVAVKNCIVDCDITATACGTANAAVGYAGWTTKQNMVAGVGPWAPASGGSAMAFENVVYSGNIVTDGAGQSVSGALVVGATGNGFSVINVLTLSGDVAMFRDANKFNADTIKNVYGTKVPGAGNMADAWTAANQWGYATAGGTTTAEAATTGDVADAYLRAGWVQPQEGFLVVPAAFQAIAPTLAKQLAPYIYVEPEIPVQPDPDTPVAPSGTGAGTAEDPYLIGTAAHLADVATWSTKGYVKLTANIDMKDTPYTPAPVFAGVFDGDGFIIENITITSNIDYYGNVVAGTGTAVGGLIGDLQEGTIKNVGLFGLTMNLTTTYDGENHSGFVAGHIRPGSTIENVVVFDAVANVSQPIGHARFGAIGGYSNNGGYTVKNVAIVDVAVNGASNVYAVAGNNSKITLDSVYLIWDNVATARGWSGGNFFDNAQKFYMVGKAGTDTEYGKTYASLGVAGFYDGKDGAITEADLYGAATGFSADEWILDDEALPLPKVFEKQFAAPEEPVVPESGTGAGTEADPYLIGTAAHLADVATWSAKGFVLLTADIDMTDVAYTAPAEFAGVFNGNGHAIKNLKQEITARYYQNGCPGAFITVMKGTLKNVAFLNWDITASQGDTDTNDNQFGVLFGKTFAGSAAENIYITGNFKEAADSATRIAIAYPYAQADGCATLKNIVFKGFVDPNFDHFSLGTYASDNVANNCYFVLDEGSKSVAVSWTGAGGYNSVNNFYSTGTTKGGKPSGWISKTWEQLGTASFWTAVGDATVTEAHMYGDAMGFGSEEWIIADDATPIQKVFADLVFDEGSDEPEDPDTPVVPEEPTVPESGKGAGTEADPYLIGTAAHLADVATWSTKGYVKLTANIDMTDVAYTAPATFAGVFDGNGFVISNLKVARTAYNHSAATASGIFVDCLALNAVIKNVAFLGLEATFTADSDSSQARGGLVGFTQAGSKLENILIEGSYIGVGADVRLGIFYPYTQVTNDDQASANMKNLVFVGSVTGTQHLNFPAANPWGDASLRFQANSAYAIFTEANLKGSWMQGGAMAGCSKVYATGITSGTTMGENGGGTTWGQIGDAAFWTAVGDATVTVDHMLGNTMGFDANEWIISDETTPVQKVFAENIDVILEAMGFGEEAPVDPQPPVDEPVVPIESKIPFTGATEAEWLTLREAIATDSTVIFNVTAEQIAPYFDLATDRNNQAIKNAEGLAIFNLLFRGKMVCTDVNSGNFQDWIYNRGIILAADIDLSNIDWVAIANYGRGTWNCFTFDGQGHTISNLVIDADVAADVAAGLYPSYGLFGDINNKGPVNIKNVALLDSSITVHNNTADKGVYVGGLMAYAYGDQPVSISNSIVECDFDVTSDVAEGAVLGGYGSWKASAVVSAIGPWTGNVSGNGGITVTDVLYVGSMPTTQYAAAVASFIIAPAGATKGFALNNILGLANLDNTDVKTQLFNNACNFNNDAKNIYGTAAAGDANAWGNINSWGYGTIGGAVTAETAVGAVGEVFATAGWTKKADKLPLPAAFAGNYDVIIAAIAD